MQARIFQPAKTAMQSGIAKTQDWVLEYGPSEPRELDPLMGWTGSRDTQAQVRLRFETLDEALAYARENRIDVVVTRPHPRKANVRPRGYGENFATDRREPWSH